MTIQESELIELTRLAKAADTGTDWQAEKIHDEWHLHASNDRAFPTGINSWTFSLVEFLTEEHAKYMAYANPERVQRLVERVRELEATQSNLDVRWIRDQMTTREEAAREYAEKHKDCIHTEDSFIDGAEHEAPLAEATKKWNSEDECTHSYPVLNGPDLYIAGPHVFECTSYNKLGMGNEPYEAKCVGDFIAAANPEIILKLITKLKQQEEDLKFLLSFIPINKKVTKGLDPTFYHTLTFEGDVELQNRIILIEQSLENK